MKERKRVFSRDFKNRAVALSYEKGNIAVAAKELGILRCTLCRWRQDSLKYGSGSFPGFGRLKLSPEDRQIHDLEKKIIKTNLKFEILKKAGRFLLKERAQLFSFIAENEKTYSIRLMCSVLEVNRATYHKWKNPLLSERQKRKILIQEEIANIFHAYEKRYGSKRIAAELQNMGYEISSFTVNKYMNELGLTIRTKKIKGNLEYQILPRAACADRGITN
ncbi:transposase [Flavobacterium tistrianum]|uniref:transposase n=1 Tax=Flavobacterium tistrianum TaxID=1685414 RepID=UPI000DAC552D|nr:transposase [Flavobacterium tistrianum]KAF2343056.1 transposase [Flavobacterium tistrianum]